MLLGHIKSYFEHHRAERNGSIIILSLIALVWGGTEVAFYFQEPPEVSNAALDIYFENQESIGNESEEDALENYQLADSLFPFNPNELSDSGFAALGFPEKDIAMLRKYQNAGGYFQVKSDFARMYFLTDSEYVALEPFISLPEQKPTTQDTTSKQSSNANRIKWSDTASTQYYSYSNIICDLNLADTNELKELPYIGSFYARKIVERREQLGGYHNIAQLLELWKMTPETIDKFADRVSIDLSAIEKLDVNSATAQELSRHPYISAHLASQIVLTRESNGSYEGIGNNCLEGLLNAELCTKLAPYLAFE